MNLSMADILQELECHDKVVQQGTNSLRFAREVNSLFGPTNVDHSISSFGSRTFSPTWDSVAYFAGRYILELQVPISIDYQKCRLIGVMGELFVQINEVVKVDLSSSGIAGATEQGQWRLNEGQWDRLVSTHGDWSAVNVPILTNAPVKGFDEFERQAREPIRNRKEGFDIPVRQALEFLRHLKATNADGTHGRRAADYLPSSRGTNAADCYERVIRDGVEKLVLPAEVNSLFGATNVDHLISNFGTANQTPVWYSVTYFAGRYRAVLGVPVSIDYRACKLDGAMNSTVIQIEEVTRVDFSKPATPRAVTAGRWMLGEDEWKWLIRNNGDWSAVKLPLRTNSPVARFGDYVRWERGRPPLARLEDFDHSFKSPIGGLKHPVGGVKP
jgi:hypothetical protein